MAKEGIDMSLADAYGFATRGVDQFDHLRGYWQRLIETLKTMPDDVADEMLDIHLSGNSDDEMGGVHIIDNREVFLEWLEEMIQQIDDMRDKTQRILAAIP